MSGDSLVCVQAQIMSKDATSGDWVPYTGVELSTVSLRKQLRSESRSSDPSSVTSTAIDSQSSDQFQHLQYDYEIHGKRISDEAVVLNCIICKDFKYYSVMPTFHHWIIDGDKNYGLNFLTATDANVFDKNIRMAVEDLLLSDCEDVLPSPTVLRRDSEDAGDDDVFMSVTLPQELAKPNINVPPNVPINNDEQQHQLQRINSKETQSSEHISFEKPNEDENDSYVQPRSTLNEYINPIVIDDQPRISNSGNNGGATPSMSHQKPNKLEMAGEQQIRLPPKASSLKSAGKYRCKYCSEVYTADKNPKGSCRHAPDILNTAIDSISCIWCVQCVCYHCASDSEGDYVQHPCICTAEGNNCVPRWTFLTLLSICLPCLWLYPPLKLCHWCGRQCRICGSRHAV